MKQSEADRIVRSIGAVARGWFAATLESTFGADWVRLSADHARLVMADAIQAGEEDPTFTAREYRRRIGDGNLGSYARTLAVTS